MKSIRARPLIIAMALSSIGVLSIGSTLALAEGETPLVRSKTESACQRIETWTLGTDIPKEVYDDLKQTASGKLPPVRGFSEGLALRRFSQLPEAKAFGEYWVARALYESKLFHTATDGFTSLAAKKVSTETIGIQIAALECLTRIVDKYPTLKMSDEIYKQLGEYQALAETPHQKKVIFNVAGIYFRNFLNEDRSPEEIDSVVALLKGAGPGESFAKGVLAAKRHKHTAAIPELEAFLASTDLGSLKKQQDSARLILARSYYSKGDFFKAGLLLKKIPKTSNHLAVTLEELAWANLMDERYSEAIGASLSLQAGGLRKTYAPEAPMIMAMAMNELCQYPESVKAINSFRKNYESVYRWLMAWDKSRDKSASDHLYAKAIEFVKKKNDLPVRLGTEWIRSTVLTSVQDELNLLFDERDGAGIVEKSGGAETKRLSNEILTFAQGLKARYRVAKIQQMAGKPMPKNMVADLDHLRIQVLRLRRLQQSAPVWKIVMRNFQHHVPETQKRLVATVDEDLTRRSNRMLSQLDEIAENLQLVEVEIYNGASQDIIWQNAHPEYRKLAQDMKSDAKANPEQVWRWGRAPTSVGDEEGEIWEDELDSFKADLFDNCSSKDKYLALRLGR